MRTRGRHADGWGLDVTIRYRVTRISPKPPELGERGIDLVSAVLGNRQIATIRKRYAPVLVSRLKDASERMSGRFQGWQAYDEGQDDGTAREQSN